jgi:hypothetical protein
MTDFPAGAADFAAFGQNLQMTDLTDQKESEPRQKGKV